MTKKWIKLYEPGEGVFKAIMFKEVLENQLINLWIKKNPSFQWRYKIELGPYTTILTVILSNAKEDIRDFEESIKRV